MAEQAAKTLGWSGSKVSRIETGKQLESPDDVRKLVGLYDVGEDEIEKYVAIARQARQRDWWHQYDDVLPDWFEGYLGLEAEASTISTYESDLVPGLLQTEQYAVGVLGAFPLETTPEERERAVDLRRARQARLSDDTPLMLPFAAAEHPGINGAFSALKFPDPDDGRIVCVEVANLADGHRPVRDSKNPAGPALAVTPVEWSAFTAGVRAGELD